MKKTRAKVFNYSYGKQKCPHCKKVINATYIKITYTVGKEKK